MRKTMRALVLGTLIGVHGAFPAALFALTPEQKQQVQQLMERQKQLNDLRAALLKTPEDRALYRKTIEQTLVIYEQIYTKKRFDDEIRPKLLVVKEVLEDMWAINDLLNNDRPKLWSKGIDPYAELKKGIVPGRHKRKAPLVDPWGTPYKVFVAPGNGQYKIVCAGSDKEFDPANLGLPDPKQKIGVVKSSDLGTDIVFVDNVNFTAMFDYPERAQTFLYEAVMRW